MTRLYASGYHRVVGAPPTSFQGTSRYQVVRELGTGGMGVVYEAFDRERQMTVALKVVHELDAHGLYRLKTEFRARADLEHRNLVRLGEPPARRSRPTIDA